MDSFESSLLQQYYEFSNRTVDIDIGDFVEYDPMIKEYVDLELDDNFVGYVINKKSFFNKDQRLGNRYDLALVVVLSNGMVCNRNADSRILRTTIIDSTNHKKLSEFVADVPSSDIIPGMRVRFRMHCGEYPHDAERIVISCDEDYATIGYCHQLCGKPNTYRLNTEIYEKLLLCPLE